MSRSATTLHRRDRGRRPVSPRRRYAVAAALLCHAALWAPVRALAQAPPAASGAAPAANVDVLGSERRDVERLSKELTGLTQQAETLARDLQDRQREAEAAERERRNRSLALFAGLGAAIAAYLFVRSRRRSVDPPTDA